VADTSMISAIDLGSNMLGDQVDRDRVVGAVGNDDVGMLLGGSNIIIERRLDEALVLLENTIKITASLGNISTHYKERDMESE